MRSENTNEKNNGIFDLAKLLKGMQNPPAFAPVFGVISELPILVIRRGTKILIGEKQVKSLINLYETDINGEYVHLGKTVAMLPYNSDNSYLVLGVVQNG